jgi:adenylylsulfate kinase
MAGLPGTGKTALAEALAQCLGGAVLSKDRVRAALFPPGTIDYSDAQDDFCMSVVLQAAQRIAVVHKVPFIFLDGRTFSRQQHVRQAVEAAATAGASLDILHLHCPETLALERIQRDSDRHPAANRDAALFFRVQARYEPITRPKLCVDTSQPLAECVAQCVEYLVNH